MKLSKYQCSKRSTSLISQLPWNATVEPGAGEDLLCRSVCVSVLLCRNLAKLGAAVQHSWIIPGTMTQQRWASSETKAQCKHSRHLEPFWHCVGAEVHSTMLCSWGIPGKLGNQHGSAWRSSGSPGRQGSDTAPAHCTAQGSEPACLVPAGQSLHGAGSHRQQTRSWAYLIAPIRKKEWEECYWIQMINQQSKKRQLHDNTICSGPQP